MAGITPEGFIPKTLKSIRNDIITECMLIQDPETGQYPLFDINDDTVLSQVIGVFAAELEIAWKELSEVYAQFDPQMNTGAGQSGTVQINAITRKAGSYSQILISVSGKANSTIQRGAKISDAKGDYVFEIDNSLDLVGTEGSTVEVEGTATALYKGELRPPNGAVNTIQTPHFQNPPLGWFGVSNTALIKLGTNEETDSELRKRQQRSTALTSYRHVDAIWAALLNIDGVTYARVYQNSSNYPEDSRGIPYKEVAAIVEGGNPEEITDVLFYRLPTGQIGFGNTTVEKKDNQNILYPISFSRPSFLPIYIRMTLRIYDSTEWPSNGGDLIRQYIIEYAKYNSIDADIGFPPGTDVIRSRLYTPINAVQGHSVLKLELSRDNTSFQEADIPVEWNQLAVFLPENIVIYLT